VKKEPQRRVSIPRPWVPSWAHYGVQGLMEFGERQRDRLKKAGKQRRVVVTMI
jgi:hypothetical protein